VVSDVSASIEKFQQEAEDLGGYLVNYRTNNPTEAASGNITVRVPANSLKVFLGSLRNNAVKVVSENIDGRDVTDEYMDIESRLVTLRKTRDTFEGIMEKATNVDEILRVQQAIFNVQDQIDNLQGSLMYLDATSQSSLVTIYLSTDEFELPYTPDQPWRPSVVFKYAVRSLVGALRGLGTAAIWIGVYSVVWLPVLIVVYFLRKKRRNRTMTNVM
jgi:hypothetical protein